jgi:pyruvate dehydrogenase E2 component (dihydrolipoamide acetyltransferase)
LSETVKAVAAGRRDPPQELVVELSALGIAPGSYDYQPLDAVRRTIARRMTDAFRDVPHFPLLAKIEIDSLVRCRKALNDGRPEARLSLNDMIIKAAALALKAYPAANASYTARGLVFHNHADISVAVAIEGGLVTPIIRHAEEKSLHDISREMKDLAERGRAKRLMPDEYFGGTFSISNLGMFGVASFGSILNSPQGCILSIGEPEKQYRFRGDDPYVATVMDVTLTCDHRVVDGATGARWLQAFRQLVEEPDGWAA